MIEQDPTSLYPNSVADALVEGLRAENPDFEVRHYGKDLFRGSGGDLQVHTAAYQTTGCFIHALGTEPVGVRDEAGTGVVDERWRGRVRLAHHNPRDEVEQHQEGLIHTQRARAYLQGTRIPTSINGVEGGRRLLRVTSQVEQVVNVMDFAVYRFDIDIRLQHNLQNDI